MLFYLLGDIERLVAEDENEYKYVRGDGVLMQSSPENPYGDNELASPRPVHDIMNALSDVSFADLLVLIANDETNFDYYPLTLQSYQDPTTGNLVAYEPQERIDLRVRLTELLSNPNFRYGQI
ncbi:MAG: hypothetical protein RSD40_03295 [Bacilli bacterium]|uniref:hypothetical protein n=1 Tax=Acinetobacter sp. 1207_04 TaxID=2604449 RepID=UPI003AA5D381